MDTTKAIREMIEASGMTHRQIASRMGRYDAYVSQLVSRGTEPRVDTLASVASACGYRLELVPLDGGASITIGEGLPDRDDAPSIGQARALLARAASILDQMNGTTTN